MFCAMLNYLTLPNHLLRVILAAALNLAPVYIGATLPGIATAQSGGFFVSAQNGNDSWSGLLASPNSINSDGPFRTLAKAQSAMRASGTKTTTVRAGTYSVASVWRL